MTLLFCNVFSEIKFKKKNSDRTCYVITLWNLWNTLWCVLFSHRVLNSFIISEIFKQKMLLRYKLSLNLPSLLCPEPCLMSLVSTVRRTTRLATKMLLLTFRVIFCFFTSMAFRLLSYKITRGAWEGDGGWAGVLILLRRRRPMARAPNGRMQTYF